MSRNSLTAATLPSHRTRGRSFVESVDRHCAKYDCVSALHSRRRIGHRVVLLLVLVWAIVMSLSAGAHAQTDQTNSKSAKQTAKETSAVALRLPHTGHLSRRQTAPELQVAAWIDQSGPVKAPQLRGKVQLVVFWGVNCPACVRKIPKVRDVAQRYNDTDLVVIGLHNAHINPERVAKFARDRGLNYPIAVDRSATKRASWGMTSDAYHVRAIPHAAVVDRDGSLKFVGQFEKALQTAESLLKVTSG